MTIFFRNIFHFLLCALFLLSISSWAEAAHEPGVFSIITDEIHSNGDGAMLTMPKFSAIVVKDNIQLEVRADQPRQKMVVQGSVQLVVKQGVLYLSYFHPKGSRRSEFYPPHVTLDMQQLLGVECNDNNWVQVTTHSRSLVLVANGACNLHVRGTNLGLQRVVDKSSGDVVVSGINHTAVSVYAANSGSLRLTGNIRLSHFHITGSGPIFIKKVTGFCPIHHSGSGRVTLEGVINVSYIELNGDAWLTLYWIKSDDLKIKLSDRACLKLAGVTRLLRAELYDNSRLEARFVRSNTAVIETHDNARADVWVRTNLYALALGHSNIYYYTDPEFVNLDKRNSGTVLKMEEIPTAILYFH